MNRQQVKRQVDTRKLLNVLRAAKSRQDDTAQPYRGRGLWLSSKQWHALTKHLEKQVLEVEVLEQVIYEKEQEAEQLRQQLEAERLERARVVDELHAQAAQLREQAEFPLAELGALRSQMRSKQETWDKQKHELEGQMDRLMGVLRKMGLLADSEGQRLTSAPAHPATHDPIKEFPSLMAPEVQALQVRELSMLLADARHQAESYRRQLAMRGIPAEEMAIEIKRLKTDNQRLVALLAKVPEYKAMAEEIAAESGLHYIPVEECLMIRGQVEQLYPQLLDRPVEQAAGQELAAAGRRRDPDCLDPSLTLVLDEQYHWVPRNALETGMELMRRMLPALPMSQLLVLVAELNKVWRDRERKRLAEVAVAHREELQQLQHTFQQRAPYEAVLAGQKINDLKRRMRAQAAQAAAAAAAAKAEQRRVEDDSKVMLHAGLSSIQDLSRQVARLVSRNKKLASKAARKRALTSQPLCSACLDRLLLSDTLGQPRTGAVGMQHPSHHRQQQQQQEEMDGSTVAAQPHELDFDTGATATTTATTENPGPERLYGNGAACNVPSPHSPRFADGSNRHGSRTARDTFPGSSERRLGPDIPTFNLTARNASGAAAGTGAYTTGVVVSVNTVPPLAQPPRPALGLSCPSGSRTHGSVASPRLLTSTSAISTAAERGQCDSDLGIIPSESPATVPGNYLGPVHADRLDGRNFVTSNTSGSSAAATEASAASLADWRTAASAPITVHLEVRGPNQQNLMMRSGAAQGSDRGNLATTSATSQARVQPRGVPLRVSVRFPRQDIAGSQ